MTICVLICTSGRIQNRSLSESKGFCPKSKTTVTTRRLYSRTSSASTTRLSSPETRGTRGRNTWARERVKAHTKRCREYITRRSLRHITQGQDSTTDDSSNIEILRDKLSVTDKLPIVELTVDTTLVGSTSTPKSSPASFSDVSAMFHLKKIV